MERGAFLPRLANKTINIHGFAAFRGLNPENPSPCTNIDRLDCSGIKKLSPHTAQNQPAVFEQYRQISQECENNVKL